LERTYGTNEPETRRRMALQTADAMLPSGGSTHVATRLRTHQWAVLWPLLAVACAMVLWGASLSSVDLRRMNDLGLLSVLPPATFAAFGVLTISFCIAVHQRMMRVSILLPHVVALIIMIHGTPAILYGTLRYSWAWKHVGIVDYIQRHGSVDPSISFLNVYHNWPGFFALAALITELAGFKSALSFASWGPPFFNLLYLGGLVLIFGTFTKDRRLIWLSIWFFYLTNWVGQDYFSPQALSYFLNLVILGICLRWFKVAAPPTISTIKRWLVFDRAAYLFHKLITLAARGDTPETELSPLNRAGLVLGIVLIFAFIVSSHQLTPFMTILAVAGLVVFQRCRLRSLPLLMTVMTVAWIVFMAEAFLNGNLYWIVQSIGSAEANANSNLIDASRVSPGLQIVSLAGRTLTALVASLALVGTIRRLRKGYIDLSCIVLAIAPIPMLASNSYGGEILFRVYFFALPFLVFLAAALLYPSPATAISRRTVFFTVEISCILLVLLGFAYYGKERMYYFTKNEVAAAQYLYNIAPRGSLLLDGTWNYPWAFHNYERYTYQSLAFEHNLSTGISQQAQQALLSNPVADIARVMGDKRYTKAYLIITRSQKADVDENGWLPVGSLDVIERAVMHSKRFKVVLANRDAAIFTLATSTKGAGQRSTHPGGH
jgi:hypothetical protein